MFRVTRIGAWNCPRLDTFKTDSWLPTMRSGKNKRGFVRKFWFLTFRGPLAAHDSNLHPNCNLIARSNAIKVGGLFPFYLRCFFFVFGFLMSRSPRTRANNYSLLDKWGISLQLRLHLPHSELSKNSNFRSFPLLGRKHNLMMRRSFKDTSCMGKHGMSQAVESWGLLIKAFGTYGGVRDETVALGPNKLVPRDMWMRMGAFLLTYWSVFCLFV